MWFSTAGIGQVCALGSHGDPWFLLTCAVPASRAAYLKGVSECEKSGYACVGKRTQWDLSLLKMG